MFLLQVHKITLHIEITCKLGHRCLFLMVRYYSWYTCSGVLTKKLAPVCTQEWGGGGCTCIQVNLTPWWTVVMVFIYMKWCHLVNKVILHWCKQLNLLSYLNSSQTTDYITFCIYLIYFIWVFIYWYRTMLIILVFNWVVIQYVLTILSTWYELANVKSCCTWLPVLPVSTSRTLPLVFAVLCLTGCCVNILSLIHKMWTNRDQNLQSETVCRL